MYISQSIGKTRHCLVCDDELRTTDNEQDKKVYCSKQCKYFANYQTVILNNMRKRFFMIKWIAKDLGMVKHGWYVT